MTPHRSKLQHGIAGFCLLLLLTACRVVQETAQLPGKTVGVVTGAGKTKATAVDPVELQQTLLRLADEFTARTAIGIEKLRRSTNALDPAEALQWKIALVTETCAIASGPNAFANVLDMTVFVTVSRAAIEDHWKPNVFGDSADPLLESCRSSETNVWRLASRVLMPEHREELRAAIDAWRRENPLPEGVLAARAVGFASQVSKSGRSDPAKPGSVFSLLMLDPLAGMDPAVREIAQSRLFAERAFYVSQKMPTLLRWQTELLTVNATRMPAVQQLVSNSTQLASVADRFAGVAEQLPKLVNEQRQAGIQQIFDGVASERTNLIATLAADEMRLRATLVELRQTLDAGTELVKSSDAAIKTTDGFLRRFDPGTNAPAPAPAATNTRPFDILDYASTAKEVTATIKELNATITSLDKALPQIQKAGDAFEAAGARLLNRLLLIGGVLIVIAFAAALIYRRLPNKSQARNLAPAEPADRVP